VPKEELIGTNFSLYFTEPEKADLGYRQVFTQGYATDYPLTIRHRNGTLMDVLYNAAVYKDEGGNVLGIFAAARDVTARKRAEEELAVHRRHLEELVAARTAELQTANQDLRSSRRAALNLLKDAVEARRAVEQAEEGLRRSAEDLARSNKDLEQFAYVASHDLQEPLRAVGGFMGLLKNQYYNNLDDQAREYIDFSVEGAERMQSLIEGLLAYSRVGTRGGEFAPISLESALNAATANLKFLITESQAAITNDPLPVVTADLLQMTQLLQNLVANAVKFHGPHSPEIHIGAQRKERAWEIYVRDNGIGIDSQYFDRIFLIFQRLHTRTQYKGTGIGLAVCKKIVERHGGKIWVESVPGQGSTFCFNIPDKGESA
jgi:light-regulated signal transduction histidine kinase (bacteriophytochrome)